MRNTSLVLDFNLAVLLTHTSFHSIQFDVNQLTLKGQCHEIVDILFFIIKIFDQCPI